MTNKILGLLAALVLLAGCAKDAMHNGTDIAKINDELLSPYLGTYLPEPYLDELEYYNSHVQASIEFRQKHEFSPNVIVLNQQGMECNYNFHEGENLKLVSNNRNSVTVKTYDGNETCELQVNQDNQYLVLEGVIYVKVADATTMSEEVISDYLAEHLLTQEELQDKSSNLYVEDNKVYYNGQEYNYGLDLVFTGHDYDQIVSTDSLAVKYIKILDNLINIYSGYVPSMDYDTYWDCDQAYELEYQVEL